MRPVRVHSSLEPPDHKMLVAALCAPTRTLCKPLLVNKPNRSKYVATDHYLSTTQDYWSFLKGSKRYWSHIGTEKGSESERCHASLPNSWDFEEKFYVDEEWILHIINLNCQRRIVLSLHNLKPLWCNSFEHIKEFGNIPSQKWTSIGEVGMLPLEYKFSQISSTQPADEQVLKVL